MDVIRIRLVPVVGVMVLVASLLALTHAPAAAQTTYVVDAGHITGNAAVDDPPPSGSCDPGDCSLREAVIAANSDAAADVIEFEIPGTVALGLDGVEADDASANDLDLTEGVMVAGHADGTTIDVTGLSPNDHARAFHVLNSGSGSIAVELRDLTITGGAAASGGAVLAGPVQPGAVDLTLTRTTMSGNRSGDGGAVRAGETALTVVDSVFVDNRAGRDGGAIHLVQSDSATITGSTFTGNHAGSPGGTGMPGDGWGGAISVNYDGAGPLITIADSTFTANDAGNETNVGRGGAIFALGQPLSITDSVVTGNGSETTFGGGGIYLEGLPVFFGVPGGGQDASAIINSDVSGNTAHSRGGGIHVASGADVELTSSTVSNNEATTQPSAEGGGIWVDSQFAQLRVTNTTISGNTSSSGGGGIHLFADPAPQFAGTQATTELLHTTVVGNEGEAGVAIDQPGGPRLQIRSSLIADNRDANCLGSAAITSAGSNLEDADTCTLDQPSDQVDTDPTIGPLADNGGAPQGADGSGIGFTHALLEGSPAIDTAAPETCPDPVDEDQRGVTRPQLEGCDIGAYEFTQVIDVAVEKSVDPASIEVEENASFTIEVTNVGTVTADLVTLTDVVPDTLDIVSVAPDGICDPPAGQSLTCDLGALAVGASITITVEVTGTVAGSYTNTAGIAVEGDVDTSNDTASATLTVGRTCTGADQGEGEGIDPGIVRVEGLNRIQTAIAASQAACGDGEAPAIVLTRADLFPDAQAGTPLAIDLGAPLLLSEPASLSTETGEEIERVLAPGGTVYLLGGEVALSAQVDQQVRDLGYTTVRYGGQNRFGTAAIIADDGLDNPATVLFADGGDFADSIVAGAAAAAIGNGTEGAAVLLTSGADIPPETQAYLDGRTSSVEDSFAIGAQAAIAFPEAEEVSGPTRFETGVAVAERFFTDPVIVGVARADDFADGLTGGALVGRPELGPGPILLVATDALPPAVEAYLTANAATVETAVLFGGTSAITADVEAAIAGALGF